MRLTIKTMRAAGLNDAQILKVLEEADAEQRERWRIIKRNQRLRPLDMVDCEDIEDKVDTALTIEAKKIRKERKKVSKTPLSESWIPAESDFDPAELREFKNSALAHNRRYANWNAAWENWKDSPFNHRRRKNGTFQSHPGQPSSGAITPETFAKVRAAMGSRPGEPADGVVSQGGLSEPGRLHRDSNGDFVPVRTGNSPLRDGPYNGNSASMQVASGASGNRGSVCGRDNAQNEGSFAFGPDCGSSPTVPQILSPAKLRGNGEKAR